MIWPPSILRIRITEKGSKGIRLWLPILLLWPLIGLGAIFAPVVLAFVPDCRRQMSFRQRLLAGPVMLLLFCRLRGLRIDVGGGDGLHISFI